MYKLNIRIIEAKDLPKMDFFGKSDPYVNVKVAGQMKKTKIIKRTLNPHWDESFDFEFNNLHEDIILYIKDWDKLSSDDLIGKISIPILDLKNGVNKYWFNISDKFKHKKPSIHVGIYLFPHLRLTILNGKNLPSMDLNGLCDPYVEIDFQDKTTKTSVKRFTLDPSWNEKFDFRVEDVNSKIVFHVWDDDIVTRELIGSVELPLQKIKKGFNKHVSFDVPIKATIFMDIEAIGFGIESENEEKK
eukprot:gene1743-512_t